MICAARVFHTQSMLTTNAPLLPLQKVREQTDSMLVSKNHISMVTMNTMLQKQEHQISLHQENQTERISNNWFGFFLTECSSSAYLCLCRREYPVISKSFNEAKLFNGKYLSLLKLVHNLDFKYQTNSHKLLLESIFLPLQ